jgi:hypothetical protein
MSIPVFAHSNRIAPASIPCCAAAVARAPAERTDWHAKCFKKQREAAAGTPLTAD